MTDIAISYDSTNRGFALRVAEDLRGNGLSVWIDDAAGEFDDDAFRIDLVGIAAGAPHRQEVMNAILGASALVVLDTPRWRNSAYCRWEYEIALAAGKRIAVLRQRGDKLEDVIGDTPAPQETWSVNSINDIIDRFGVGLGVAEAQSRLLLEAEPHRLGLWGRLQRPDQGIIADAATVLEQQTAAATGITITPSQQKTANEILARDRSWRRRRSILVATSFMLVVAIAVASIVFWRVAEGRRSEAVRDASIQRSLQLADQSQTTVNSFKRLSLAELAVRTAETPQSKAALKSAQIGAKQYTRFTVPSGRYTASAIAGDTMVIGSADGVTAVDLARGSVRSFVSVGGGLTAPALAVTSDGRDVVVSSRATGKLVDIDLVSSRAAEIPDSAEAVAFAVDREKSLWWPTDGGLLVRQPYPWTDVAKRSQYPLPFPTTAVSVDGQDRMWALAGDGAIYHLRTLGGQVHVDTPKPVFPSSSMGFTLKHLSSSGMPDRVLTCPDKVIATRDRAIGGIGYDGTRYPSDTSVLPITAKFSGVLYAPACLDGGALYNEGATSATATFPPGLPDPVKPISVSVASCGQTLASSVDAKTIALATCAGRVTVIHRMYAPDSVDTTQYAVTLPLPGGAVFGSLSGDLYRLDGERMFARSAVASLGISIVPQEPFESEGSVYLLGEGPSLARVWTNEATNRVQASWCTLSDESDAQRLHLSKAGDGSTTISNPSSYATVVLPQSTAPGSVCNLRWKPVPGLVNGESIWTLALNRQRTLAAVGTSRSRILLFDTRSEQILARRGFGVAFTRSDLAFDGADRLVGSSGDGKLAVFDDGLEILQARSVVGGIRGMNPWALSGHAIIRPNSGPIQVVDLTTLQMVQELPQIPNSTLATYVWDAPGNQFWALGIVLPTSSSSDKSVTEATPGELIRIPAVEVGLSGVEGE